MAQARFRWLTTGKLKFKALNTQHYILCVYWGLSCPENPSKSSCGKKSMICCQLYSKCKFASQYDLDCQVCTKFDCNLCRKDNWIAAYSPGMETCIFSQEDEANNDISNLSKYWDLMFFWSKKDNLFICCVCCSLQMTSLKFDNQNSDGENIIGPFKVLLVGDANVGKTSILRR